MKRFGLGLLRGVGECLRSLLIGIIMVAVGTGVIAVANYAVTQGSGTNFASLVISTVHYAAMVICDVTVGQSRCLTINAGGNAQVAPGAIVPASTTWDGTTTLNTDLMLQCPGQNSPTITANLVTSGTISAGAVSFQYSNDATPTDCTGTTGTWFNFPAQLILSQQSVGTPISANPYALPPASTNAYNIVPNNVRAVKIRLTTQIVGAAGQVVITPTVGSFLTSDLGLYNPIIPPTNTPVSILQTTPGTTNNVTVSPLPRAARNAPGCTVGTSSAQCLAAGQAVNFLQIENVNATSTNNVACNIVGGTAVLNSLTSIQLAPGQSASWGPNTGGVPSGAINCIATSASSPLYVEWN